MTFAQEWLDTFAGDPIKIEAERLRLAQLRDLLLDTTRPEVYGWSGPAADGHLTVTDALVRRDQRAADSHEEASRALDRYQQTLTTTRELAKDAIETVRAAPQSLRAHAALESLPRWRDQLRSVAAETVIALQAVTDDLLGLPAVVPRVPEPTPEPVRLPPAPEPPTLPSPRGEQTVSRSQPPTDLLSMLSYAKPFTVPSPVPVVSWSVWQRAPGRRIGRFGEH
jgi:hypothetical protein